VIGALDDLKPEPRRFSDSVLDLMGVLAGVGPNEFQPGKALVDLVEQQVAPSRSWMPAEWTITSSEALNIDEGVAPLHLLAGVITHRVFFTPARGSPFSAAFSA
jgi:hypothetical protein